MNIGKEKEVVKVVPEPLPEKLPARPIPDHIPGRKIEEPTPV